MASSSNPITAPRDLSTAVLIRVDQSGKGDFKRIQDAINSVPSHSDELYFIWVKPGIYKEKIVVPANKPYMTLSGTRKSTTVVTWGGGGEIFESPTLSVLASNFICRYLSIRNAYGSRAHTKAVALRVSADHAAFYGCRIQSYQDTLLDDKGRHYFKNCYIEGAIDFICGSATSLFEKCHLHSVANGFTGTITHIQLGISQSSILLSAKMVPTKSDVSSTLIGSALPPSTVRLDGTNYLLWKTLILANFSGLNLHGHLDGSDPEPEKFLTEGEDSVACSIPNPAYQIWWQQDQKVLGALLTSMSPEIAIQMVGFTSADQVWSAVRDMFAAQNRATIRHTRLQLQTLKKKDMTASDYFQRMKTYADTLASIGSPISTDELIDYILTGLGPQYGPLAASLTVTNRSITLPDFYAFVLSFESMLESHTQTEDWTSSANSAARQNPNSNPRRDRNREGRRPQSGNGSSNPNSEPIDRTPNGNRRWRNGNGRFRPRCQICNIFGHDALTCHNRFNEAYTSANNHSANSASRSGSTANQWYMDSGATDHLTSDLSRLTSPERYNGTDQIQIANGSGQGNTENPSSR